MFIFILLSISILCIQQSFSQRNSIRNVDFNIDQFRRHRTVEFYSDNNGVANVIVRRGDHFQFTVELNNQFNGETVEIILSFVTKRDEMTITLPAKNEQNGWTSNQSTDDQRINTNIHIPGNAPVGVWKLRILLKNKTEHVIEQLDSPHKIIFLFNPWSKEDSAYFPEEEKLSEYLMNERGYTYSYNYVEWHSNPWIFGQFQTKVLDAVLFVLDRAKLTAAERGDIVLVSRELTYLMSDDGRYNRGVLQGRWKEPFDSNDGQRSTKPWEWMGSPPIFKQYFESGGVPVRFGQCWVFAGILTTAYRALGIASRPVSNFLSAHSYRRDLTIDIQLNERGDIEREEKIWNFHAWVQAWFSRRKGSGNDDHSGWQELDATPQEVNDGRYQVGPASNTALRNSQLRTRFESDFIYEEVNADEVVWSSDKQIVSIDHDKVGLSVMTKGFGTERAEDITRMYKPAENTTAERESYRSAAESLGIRPPSLDSMSGRSAKQKIIIDIKTKKHIIIGSPVSVKVYLKNPSSSSKQLEVTIKATSMYYNGEEAEVLKNETHNISLLGFKWNTIEFLIKPEDYIGKLHDQYTIRILIVARSGDAIAFRKKLISLHTPKLTIYGPQTVNVNEPFTMTVQIKNPFNQKLSDCHIVVEGIGIGRNVIEIEDITASSVVNVTLQLQSSYLNKETVVVHFHAKQLIQMQASIEFEVTGKKWFQFAAYSIKDTNNSNENETTEYNEEMSRTVKLPEKIRLTTADSFECCKLVTI